jgi:tetratricopeptide (TPR) repeat protein
MNDPSDNPFLRCVQAAVTRGPPAEYSARIPSPYGTRYAFEAARQYRMQTNDQKGLSTIRQTMIPPIEHGIASPIEKLKPITLREIARRVNYIHEDRVLFATTVCDPDRIVGTVSLVEDDNGDCMTVGLYNFVRDDEDPKDILPRGTHLAFLAPYMRNAGDARDRELLLRCDNPQSIQIFDSKAEWLAAKEGKPPPKEIEQPSQLRLKGNEAFKKGLLKQSTKFYSRALNHPSISLDDKIACLSNRAEVYLRKEHWEDAEVDCKAVLEMEKSHVKANFRLSKALLHLGKASQALGIIDGLLAHNADDRTFKVIKQEAERLLREENGHYDLMSMHQEQASSNLRFHADYASNAVALGVDVLKSDGKRYRGCVATENITSNTLICASKAFAYVPCSAEDDIGFQINPYSKILETGSTIALINEIVIKLYHRPMLCKLIYKLHSENKYNSESDSEKINIGRIRSIKSCNVFGTMSTNEEVYIDWENIQDMKKGCATINQTEAQNRERIESVRGGSGLWIQESMFNHSCTPNCTWSQIGDHIFIHTARAIKKHEELCITYVGLETSYLERKEKFQNWIRPGLGFKCACEWCCLLRAKAPLRKMEQEVDTAFKEAARLVTFQHDSMASAAEMVISAHRRADIMAAFKDLPLHLQNRPIQNLRVLQGTILSSHGDIKGAYQSFKSAAAIGYAVYGDTYRYCKDLWRLVGSAMRCEMEEMAYLYLSKIWSMNSFKNLDSNAQQMFSDLTIKYAAPFWNHFYDPFIESQLKIMVDMVCLEKTTMKNKQ